MTKKIISLFLRYESIVGDQLFATGRPYDGAGMTWVSSQKAYNHWVPLYSGQTFTQHKRSNNLSELKCKTFKIIDNFPKFKGLRTNFNCVRFAVVFSTMECESCHNWGCRLAGSWPIERHASDWCNETLCNRLNCIPLHSLLKPRVHS